MAIVLLASAAFTAVAYDIPYLLSTPFWWDELWVAVSVRYPIGDLPTLTSSTPIAWNAAQQALSIFGEHAQRILPLLFSTLAAAAAYFVGYLATTGRTRTRAITGTFVASTVALSPLMLQRVDLKQYTADVFITLLVIAITILIDRSGSRAALVALTAVAALGMLVSLTIPFTAASAFSALAISTLIRRRRGVLVPLLVSATVAGAGIAISYFALYAHSSSALKEWWGVRGFFPPLRELVNYVITHIGIVSTMSGSTRSRAFAAVVLLAYVLVGAMAWRSRRFVPALFLFVLTAGMLLAGVLAIYPLLDLRTSLFLFMTFVVIGALSAAHALIDVSRLVRDPRRRAVLLSTATVASIVFVTAIGYHALRSHSVYNDNNLRKAEDAPSQISYIQSHRGPGDTVIVDDRGAMALEYYWPSLTGRWTTMTNLPNGFTIVFPASSGVIVVPPETTLAQMDAIIASQRAVHPAGTIWFLETHTRGRVRVAKTELSLLPGIERIDVGVEPLFRLPGTTTT